MKVDNQIWLREVGLLLILLNHSVSYPRLQFDGGGGEASNRLKRDIIGNTEVNYLIKFGYLPQSTLETGALVTGNQFSNAISNLQKFGGLEITGELDPDTIRLMSAKRCGVHDVSSGFRNRRRRYALQGEHWTRNNLTWSLTRFEGHSGVGRQQVVQEIHTALNVWSSYSNLKFTYLYDSDQADIRISFHKGYHGDGYPFDGAGAVLAHAFFPGSGRGGDAHFDEEEKWIIDGVVEKYDEIFLFPVALHEFGHSLGLSHSSVPGSVMFPWYSDNKPVYSLPRDDRLAIQALYGAPHRQDEYFDEDNTVEKDYREEEDPDIPTRTTSPSTTSTTLTPEIGVPARCETDFDAVAFIRSEMWAFKGRYFWRINKDGGTREDPVELGAFWYGLPSDIDHVDAVYEKQNHDIVFFVGKRFYVLSGNSQLKQGPRPLTDMKLPKTLEKVDGAMKWGHNQKTYLFSKDMYWRYDEERNEVELDYPRDISLWKGVPSNIDAVFQYIDKKTYFFKDTGFWEFDDARMRVVDETATPVGEYWFHCPKQLFDPTTGSNNKLSIHRVLIVLTLAVNYGMFCQS